ncbi:MAG: MCP four helix bundle domain-containing protein, partial [Actinomycetes bacterium]
MPVDGSTTGTRGLAVPSPQSAQPTEPRSGRLRWFTDRGVRTKVLVSSLVLSAVGIGVGAIGFTGIHDAMASEQEVYDTNVTGLIAIGRVHQEEIKSRMLLAQHAVAQSSDEKAKVLQKIAGSDAELDSWAAKFDKVALDDADWQTFQSAWKQWRQVRDQQMVPFSNAGRLADFQQAQSDVAQTLIDQAADALDGVETAEQKAVDALVLQGQASTSSDLRLIVIALGVGIVLALALAWWVASGIRTSLWRVRRSLDAMASGDLTVAPGVSGADEVAAMSHSLETAQAGLRELVSGIARAGETLVSTSAGLATTGAVLHENVAGTDRQAQVVGAAAEQVSRNVQTVATGSEEMGASIREIAHNASEASHVAAAAVAAAEST